MLNVSPKVHGVIAVVSILGVFAAFLMIVATLVHNAWVHDGADNTTLVWFGVGTGIVLAVLLLGVPVVISMLQAAGLPVKSPLPSPTSSSSSSNTPSA